MPIDLLTVEQIGRVGLEWLKNNPAIAGGVFIGSLLSIGYFLASHGRYPSNEIPRDVRPDYYQRLKEKSGN